MTMLHLEPPLSIGAAVECFAAVSAPRGAKLWHLVMLARRGSYPRRRTQHYFPFFFNQARIWTISRS